ncbi:Uncharacterised protein [uncultured archaeon]|nr:Uncharacterised protein [uncultured archaeon]
MINILNRKNKHGQHETLGFVLIVAIVSIIIVIFLAFSIGKGDVSRQNSVEISNLLQASIYYTTDCAINYVPEYEDIQGLISDCYKNPEQKCLDGKDVCQALNKTLKTIIQQSLNVNEDSPNKAYRMNIYYSPLNNIQDKETILYFEQGIFDKCKSKPGGSYSLPAGTFSSSTINIELEICSG